mgnify:CR=1 FL=1
MDQIDKNREFLKAKDWIKWEELERDQEKGVTMPPVQKNYPEDGKLIDLLPYEDLSIGDISLKEVIKKRRSRRKFTDEYLDQEELSFLLWATQGMKDNEHLRTVPSAGARHPFETYLYINRVKGIEPGIYRYLPKEHQLLFKYSEDNLDDKVKEACKNQKFAKESAVVFIWTVIPYRTEWRYDILSHKVIALDAGHLCQNLYLASESIGAGTCAIGAYHQEKMDDLIGVDGEDEYTIYVSPVGKIEE